ncbi:unnamed protein product [Heterotrigona itama]|uniref:Odorant receptor n=1 Tax=Heterotrigona itama TaxID=395501 RepID=A0A6V7GZ46_9HYME|nr:unnamed protein product [Heterotrigona itama]
MAIHLTGQFRILRYRFSEMCDIENRMNEKDEKQMQMRHVYGIYETFKKYFWRIEIGLENYRQKLDDYYRSNLCFFQIVVLCYVGVCYFCFDNIFCIMAIHLTGQFRILQYRFSEMCDIENRMSEKDEKSMQTRHVYRIYETFKKYVRQHQALINYCKELENVYTMITLGQVLVFSILICLFGYQVLLAKASAARRSIFVFLLIGAMSLLFMFTYSCDGVIEHSDNVATGSYSALWTIMPIDKYGKMLRNGTVMVIKRSRRVCCLTAYGFFPVSLETYTTVGIILETNAIHILLCVNTKQTNVPTNPRLFITLTAFNPYIADISALSAYAKIIMGQ